MPCITVRISVPDEAHVEPVRDEIVLACEIALGEYSDVHDDAPACELEWEID